jgi:hypothetical protein
MSLIGSKTPARPLSPLPAAGSAPSRPDRPEGQSYAGFVCLRADDPTPDAKGEVVKLRDPAPRDVPYIEAEGTLPHVDLPAKMRELMDHCWKVATVPQAARQSQMQLGAGRAQAFQRAQNSQQPADIGRVAQLMKNEHIKQVSPLGDFGTVYPQDWNKANQLERVNAYTFRGEHTRVPREIEAAGGFFPPITRTDQFYVDEYIYPFYAGYLRQRFGIDLTKDEFTRIYKRVVVTPQDRDALKMYMSWRTMVTNESHHIGRMVEAQVEKNYISTSRSIGMAKYFAAANGWVYVLRVRGAFNLTSGHAYNKKAHEQECAFPGALAWSDVFGFRLCSARGGLVGPLWLRQGFKEANPTAYQKVFALMSNRILNA